MPRAREELNASDRRRQIVYIDADGERTFDATKAVQGEVIEYDLHGHPARRTKFFLDRDELPWLPVSEPAFLLWVLVALFAVWLVIGFVLIT